MHELCDETGQYSENGEKAEFYMLSNLHPLTDPLIWRSECSGSLTWVAVRMLKLERSSVPSAKYHHICITVG